MDADEAAERAVMADEGIGDRADHLEAPGAETPVEEVAEMVAWLASSDCSFSTGAVFDLSGGRATY